MKLEDAMPALRAGRRARRQVWPPGHYVEIQLIGGVRADHLTIKRGPSEHTWPGLQRESHDLLAEDWELLQAPEYSPHVPYNFREAFDMILSSMTKEEDFRPYDEAKLRKTAYPSVKGEPECHWSSQSRECVSSFMEAAAAKSKDGEKDALLRACMASLKALSYHLAERYVEEVMKG